MFVQCVRSATGETDDWACSKHPHSVVGGQREGAASSAPWTAPWQPDLLLEPLISTSVTCISMWTYTGLRDAPHS